jgi:hypothetical protein
LAPALDRVRHEAVRHAGQAPLPEAERARRHVETKRQPAPGAKRSVGAAEEALGIAEVAGRTEGLRASRRRRMW